MSTALPDFFLVGAPKAGTTSVYKYMAQNPLIFVPVVKEPNYYTNVGPDDRNVVNIKDEKRYLKLYADATPEQLKGDFSVSYMHDHDAYKKIHNNNPDAKIIMIIRHPVNRAYSHWLMDKREGFKKDEFYDGFLNDVNYKGTRGFCFNSMYYDCGLYADAITKYRSLFPNVLVLVYEEIFIDIQKTLHDIYSFLNIDSINSHTFSRHNESGEVKNKFLKAIYSSTGIRKALKVLVPESKKDFLRGAIMAKTESKISPEDFKNIAPYFKSDVIKVRELLGKPDLWANIQ